MNDRITITVPATTANLGAGFDCLGAALSLYNKFTFTRFTRIDPETSPKPEATNPLKIRVTGLEAARVATDSSNLAYQAFCAVYQFLGQPVPGVAIDLELGIPLARGLGSSATALVGGLLGANYLAGQPLSLLEIQNLAIDLEGHPDNVVPALVGGCRLSATREDGSWEICDVPWLPEIIPVVAVPNFELATAAARAVLPSTYSRSDAIFNVAHLGLLLRGLGTGKEPWLRAALQDRIHQPYRQSLIVGYQEVWKMAIDQGAYGLVISGAGPTLLALTNQEQAKPVGAAIATTWQNFGVEAEVHILKVEEKGATIQLDS
ncbi:MAG: homoserine kinase [Coleofasciculaceae cyanobacterium SM2_1_6]|nr:homoserine kinase [Coleofasciculaceae cyanobacterium SM2_1_6]